MKVLWLLPLSLVLTSCFLETAKRQISVDAKAEIEVAPDSFRMSADVRARGASQDIAMSMFSETLERVTTQLPRLEGLESVTVEPSGFEMRPVYEQNCDGITRYDEEDACPIEGYVVESTINIEGSPATVAGNAFSLASDLGVESAIFDEYFLADPSEAEREAGDLAFKKAEEKARRLASAANVTLLAPIRISDGSSTDQQFFANFSGKDTIIVTGSRLMPRNVLAITPPPITIEREISVAFEIE